MESTSGGFEFGGLCPHPIDVFRRVSVADFDIFVTRSVHLFDVGTFDSEAQSFPILWRLDQNCTLLRKQQRTEAQMPDKDETRTLSTAGGTGGHIRKHQTCHVPWTLHFTNPKKVAQVQGSQHRKYRYGTESPSTYKARCATLWAIRHSGSS